jgi:hypothetical protein
MGKTSLSQPFFLAFTKLGVLSFSQISSQTLLSRNISQDYNACIQEVEIRFDFFVYDKTVAVCKCFCA